MKGQKKVLSSGPIGVAILILSFIAVAGCSPKETVKNKTEEDALRERVMAYWDYKVRGEFDKSYGYEDPLFRKKISMVNYIKSFSTEKAHWAAASIKDAQIEGDLAQVDMEVTLEVTVTSSKHLDQNMPVKEKWVKLDGMWYHVPHKFRERPGVN